MEEATDALEPSATVHPIDGPESNDMAEITDSLVADFRKVLSEFGRLEPSWDNRFEFTTFDDVEKTAQDIQRKQRLEGSLIALERIGLFLDAIRQFKGSFTSSSTPLIFLPLYGVQSSSYSWYDNLFLLCCSSRVFQVIWSLTNPSRLVGVVRVDLYQGARC